MTRYPRTPSDSPLSGREQLVGPPPDKGELEGVEFTGYIPYRAKLTIFAKENRKNPTKAEKKMWELLRSRQFENYKFSRQKPIDNFIADFYCSELLLVIEIDGDVHSITEDYDQIRSDILKEKYGMEVIRYTNNDVLNNTSKVLENLLERITNRRIPDKMFRNDY